ncbi:cupin domain-containing protein [Furfurilactobacillus rossiae]|nr:cupin domain-containing protein [Furfurilactobacillus rossiae]QFR66276.1 cupin [Furfurilactobacillus rossiae]QLE61721.1 hypothetical protein LROSRS0_1675 [Furfurilactobacillus rossiae]
MTKDEIIETLQLTAHPEGGWFKETSHSKDTFLENRGNENRFFYTSIYFLLDGSSPSHFHRLTHDELWFFHTGKHLFIHCIFPDGHYERIDLGNDLNENQKPQYCVPAGTIFGSETAVDDSFSLVSCVVSPGFDYKDFELFTKQELLAKYPKYQGVINRLAYETIVN